MKILIACSYAWDDPGGVQVHIKDLATWLISNGHQVLVLAPGRKNARREPWVQIVGRPTKVKYKGTVASISSTSLNPVRQAIKEFQPDVIHAHEPFQPSTAMFAVLGAGKVPVVATFHAYAEDSKLIQRSAPLVRIIWNKIHLPVAVSLAAAAYVADPMKEKIRIIPNGVDVDSFINAKPRPNLPDSKKLLWVNRLDKQKGFADAVEAFARLADQFDDLLFVVAGDGEDRDLIKDLKPEVQKRVVMLGSVPHHKLPAVYVSCDIFISPAIGQESFGIVLIEAMAAGLPVVTTNIAGYKEVMDNKCGYMVNPSDPQSLAFSVANILNNPESAQMMSEAGCLHARQYSWDNVGRQLLRCYNEAILSRQSGKRLSKTRSLSRKLKNKLT